MTKVRSFGKTHPGMVELSNQDAMLVDNPRKLFAVSDGVGGHAGGDRASKAIVDTIANVLSGTPPDDIKPWLSNAVSQACANVNAEAKDDPSLKDMSATLTLLYITGNDYWIVHVGDSRAYSFADGRLTQITRDHSLAYEQYLMGAITKEDLRTHPNQKVLTRTITAGREFVIPDFVNGQVRDGEMFLLCSDGLTKDLSDEEIQERLSTGKSPKSLVDSLVDAANEAGGGDNITAVVVSTE